MACVDLYTGKTEFCKAGAPVSLVRKRGRVRGMEAQSFPVGILGEAEFARTETLLEDGDLIAMVSDGVTAGGCEWVGNLLESWPGGDPGDLAKKLVKTAREQRTDGHDDDITAVVMVLEGRPGVTPRRSPGQDREGTNC